ncbi:uncharacterized protein LOC125042543 [Penaeus chinensis]|uniref:uncharacterized protein LOC125042543 n=1 Tax=Penaeus chinensis TaxID=139456 RepID=UPI001FB8544F|nr:uncharacterized protein LOC125042543 [Penaeus chinensis]XP_047494185.1 uncharacterized protein LOC125042543 [Penaeus chinensis]
MEAQYLVHNPSGGGSSCFTTLPDSLWVKINMLNGTNFSHELEELLSNEKNYSRDTPVIVWEQLDLGCQCEQIFLFAVSVLVTIVTVVGNVFILVVIVLTGLVYEDTFLIRTALAIADLLLGLMPAALAVCDHITLMSGTTTLKHLSKTMYSLAHGSSSRMHLQFHHLRFERGGYPLACAIILSQTTSFSMFILALLSVERFCVVIGKPLRRWSIVVGLALAFVVSLLISLMLNWCPKYRAFIGYLDPVTKLTLGAKATYVERTEWSLLVSLVTWVVTGVTMVVVTGVTLFQLRRHDQRVQENLTIHSALRMSEMRRLTETLTYMILLFIISCIPCILDMVINKNLPLVHHLAWWTFMAGSSWNWALYTLAGRSSGSAPRSSSVTPPTPTGRTSSTRVEKQEFSSAKRAQRAAGIAMNAYRQISMDSSFTDKVPFERYLKWTHMCMCMYVCACVCLFIYVYV